MFEVFEVVSGGNWQRVAAVNTTEPNEEYSVEGLHPWSGHTFGVALDNSSGHVVQSDYCPITECWTLEAGVCGKHFQRV